MVVVGIERCGRASLFLDQEPAAGSVYAQARDAVLARGGTVRMMDVAKAKQMERCAGCRECGIHASVG